MDSIMLLDDPIEVYLREVSKIPSLMHDEEAELSKHVLADDEMAEYARRRLIEANLSMVISVAERYRREGVYLLDLVQKGNDGLLLG